MTRTDLRFVHRGSLVSLSTVPPTRTVLDYLREDRRLTGTKEGCAEGDCGACTVLLGRLDESGRMRFAPVNACVLLLGMIDGAWLVTVEDLEAPDGGLHPVQQAMVDGHGSQCGFCTPGFVMTIAAYQLAGDPGDAATINRWLAGNLCRCTGYGPIQTAARSVAETPPPHWFIARMDEAARLLAGSRDDHASLDIEDQEGRFFAPVDSDVLADHLEAHPDAHIVAGTTDVGLWITKQFRPLSHLVHIASARDLAVVRVDDAAIEIGAAVTFEAAMPALLTDYPEARTMFERLGSVQVRSSGTVVGNVANGSPIGDSSPFLIAVGAQLRLRRGSVRRTLPIESFFVAYGKQDRQPGEFVESILVPRRPEGLRLGVYKLSKRRDQDISIVLAALAVRLTPDGTCADARLAFGGMAGTPALASRACARLKGKPWTAATVADAQAALDEDFTPLTDHRGTDWYRQTSARNLLMRLFLDAPDEPERPAGDGAPAVPAAVRPGPQTVSLPIPHDGAAGHVTGRAIYVDDIAEPVGTLHGAVGLNPGGAGPVRSIDMAPVHRAPGVVAVITAADIPGDTWMGPTVDDEPVFATDHVQYPGQPLFLVVADTRTAARRAARLATVTVATTDPVVTIDQALAAGRSLHEARTMQRGDPEAALAASNHRLQGEIRIGGQDHMYLEGQVSLAVPQEGGAMTVHCSTQHPSEVQDLVARALAVPSAAVTVEVRRLGGGFGGKETQAAPFAVMAAVAARRLGRAVKIRLDRDDDMLATGKRHDFLGRYAVGFDDDGRIRGLDVELASRCGFSEDLSAAVNDRAMFHVDNAYHLPAVRVRSHRCRTDTVSNTAFRGFGGPQGMVVIERVIDAIAAQLGLDPLDVRQVNAYRAGQDETPYGMQVEPDAIPSMLSQLAEQADYAGRRAAVEAFNAEHPVARRGIALTPVKFGISFTKTPYNQAGALLHIYNDGSVHLNHGGVEMGQGLYQKVAQLVADSFGLPLDRVAVTATRTDKVPNTSATAASSGTDLNGRAAELAAETLKERLSAVYRDHVPGARNQITFAGGMVTDGTTPVPFPQVAQWAYQDRVSLSTTGYYRTPKVAWDPQTWTGRPFFYFAYGAAVAEVEIDTLTGEYAVRQVDILHDAGRSINPAIDCGQIEGGFIQGMGWLTMEELVFDDAGRLRTHAPSTYKIPCASDRPGALTIRLMDRANREDTVNRSKAVGEPPLMLAISVHSALSHAVSQAASGTRWPDLDAPATPEAVLRAIARLREAA